MKHIKNNNLEMCEAVANILKFIKSTSLHKTFFFFFGSNAYFILLSKGCIYSSKGMVNLCG